jgi:outer membrane protein OmpA-like peptidoglycan-associated protein
LIDVADGSPISGAQVELIGPISSKIAQTDGFGNFSFDECNFSEDEDYRVVVNKEWFAQQSDTTVNTHNIKNRDCKYITREMEEDKNPNVCSYTEGHLEYSMYRKFEMVTTRRPLELKSVLFDLGKSDLRESSKAELDSLASKLNLDWPNVVIELRSHTDLRGSDTLNHRLSFDRAQSCVDYLVQQGVNSDRLVAVGMASSEPKVLVSSENGLPPGILDQNYISSLNSNKLRELAHQENRRTDFKVIHSDFEDWLEKNPNLGDNEKTIQRAIIDQRGQVIPTDSKGNFIQQLN